MTERRTIGELNPIVGNPSPATLVEVEHNGASAKLTLAAIISLALPNGVPDVAPIVEDIAQVQADINTFNDTLGTTEAANIAAEAAESARVAAVIAQGAAEQNASGVLADATAAINARNAAIAARDIADAAKVSALSYRDAAQLAETNAETAQTQSEAARTAAEAARDTATAQAGLAAGSATVAAGHATTASDEADAAAGSATSAAAQVVLATAQAAEATNQANAAANSASAAATESTAAGSHASAAAQDSLEASIDAAKIGLIRNADYSSGQITPWTSSSASGYYFYHPTQNRHTLHVEAGVYVVFGHGEFIDIDPAQEYTAFCDLYSSADQRTYVGFECYDANSTYISNIYNGDYVRPIGPVSSRWKIRGETGAANSYGNSFVPGTAKVKPLIYANYPVASNNPPSVPVAGAYSYIYEFSLERTESEYQAGEQASASAISAQAAAASETAAGQQAAISTTQAGIATTKAAEASADATTAAAAENTATTAAATATTQANLSSTARLAAEAAESNAQGHATAAAGHVTTTSGHVTQAGAHAAAADANRISAELAGEQSRLALAGTFPRQLVPSAIADYIQVAATSSPELIPNFGEDYPSKISATGDYLEIVNGDPYGYGVWFRDEIPWESGKKYRLTAVVEQESASSTAHVLPYFRYTKDNRDGTYVDRTLGGISYQPLTVGQRQTFEWVAEFPTNCADPGADYRINGRMGILANRTNGGATVTGVMRLYQMYVEDVTSEIASAGSATASADSASQAQVSETAAGVSAAASEISRLASEAANTTAQSAATAAASSQALSSADAASAASDAALAAGHASSAASNAANAASDAATATAQAAIATSERELSASYAANKGISPNGNFNAGVVHVYNSYVHTATAPPGSQFLASYQGESNVFQAHTLAAHYLRGEDVPIDTSRVYKVRAKVYSPDTLNRFYVGLASLDESGANTGGNAGLSYCAAGFSNVPGAPGWHWFEGLITGEDPSEGSGAFRVGAKRAFPIIFMNYSFSTTGGAVGAAVSELYIEDVTESEAAASSASVAASDAATATAQAALATSERSLAATHATNAANSATASESSRVLAAAEAVAAQQSALLSASINTLAFTHNPNFIDWPTGQTYPTKYAAWVNGAPDTITKVVRPNNQGNAIRMTSTGVNVYLGTLQSHGFNIDVTQPGAKNLMECEVHLVSGTLAGCGMLLYYYDNANNYIGDARLAFSTHPDDTGVAPGAGVPGTTYKFQMFSVAPANARRVQIYQMANWGPFGATTAKTIDFYRSAVRVADPGTASVHTDAGVYVDVAGRVEAYLQHEVEAGTNRSLFSLHADGEGSSAAIIADEIALGDSDEVILFLANGEARMKNALIRGLQVAPLSGSTVFHEVSLKPKVFLASDAQAVSFGGDYTAIPDVVPDLSGLPALATGEAYSIAAQSLTSTGFTARVKKVTAGALVARAATGMANVGGTPQWRAHKPVVEDSYNGYYQFTFTVSGQLLGSEPWGGGQNFYEYQAAGNLYIWNGSALVSAGNYSEYWGYVGSSGNPTKTIVVTLSYGSVVGLASGSGYEFGIHPTQGTVSGFSGVSYSTQSQSNEAAVAGTIPFVVNAPSNA